MRISSVKRSLISACSRSRPAEGRLPKVVSDAVACQGVGSLFVGPVKKDGPNNAPTELRNPGEGSRVYVADFWSASVLVIDLASNTVARTIGVEYGPTAVALTPGG